MPDTIENRVAKLEQDLVEIRSFIERSGQNFAQTRQAITQIRREIARSVAPVAYNAPDGTVAIRDPDIIAQQYRTHMRGYAPKPILPRP